MGLMQVRDLIKKSYLDLNMVADYFDKMREKNTDEKSKVVLKYMKDNILKMSYGIQQFITFNDTPGLDVWLQYTPKLQDISDLLSHETEEMNDEQLILTAININKAFEDNFTLLSKMNLPEKVIDIFNNIRNFSQLNSRRENWHKIMNSDQSHH